MEDSPIVIEPNKRTRISSFGSGSLYHDTTELLSFIEGSKVKAYETFSNRALDHFYNQLTFALNKSGYSASSYQMNNFLKALNEIVSIIGYDVRELQIKVSGDEELLIIRSGKRGLHYIIVGSEENEIFYGFSGKKTGDYSITEFDGINVFISDIVALFLNI
jgi:hypothetical protein